LPSKRVEKFAIRRRADARVAKDKEQRRLQEHAMRRIRSGLWATPEEFQEDLPEVG